MIQADTPQGDVPIHITALEETETRLIAGETVNFKLDSTQTKGKMFLFVVDTPKGAGPPPHIHISEDETYYILSGRYEVLLGNRLVIAEAGDVIHIPAGNIHRYISIGDENGSLLTVFNPGRFEGYFRAVGKILLPGEIPTPPTSDDFERYLKFAASFGLTVVSP